MAPVKLTSPCCNCKRAAKFDLLCELVTVVCPSVPVPPFTCSVCAATETAAAGSLTTHVVGSSVATCSSINAGLLCWNGVCER